MATNPNDIARVLNEMMKTLQELSDTQLDSVQSILDEKIKQNEELKKVKKKEAALSKKKDQERKRKEKEDEVLEKKESIARVAAKKAISNLTENLKQKKKQILSTDNIASMFGVSSELETFRKIKGLFKEPVNNVQSVLSKEARSVKSLTIASMGNITIVGTQKKKTSQSNDDYLVDMPDLQSEQIATLKSIDEKIALLGGQKTGGFFDFLSNLLPNMISNAMSIGEGGLLGAGALGLGKYGKWFNIPKLASGGSNILKSLKNPKIAVPLVLGSVVAAGVGSMMFGGKEEENGLPGRASGGRVGVGQAFVVGENGPEIFTPQQNGTIIPNHKLKNKTAPEENYTKLKELIKENTRKLSKSLSSVWSDGFKGFRKSFTIFSKTVKDKFVDVKDMVVSVIKEVYENIKQFIIEKIPGFITDAGSWVAGKAKSVVNLFTGADKKEPPAPMSTTPPISTPTKPISTTIPVTTQPKPQQSRLSLPDVASAYSPNTTIEPSRAIGDYNIPKTQTYKIHQNEMIIPAAQAETMRAVLELNNDYSVRPISEGVKKNNIDEKFWMTKFVPAFAAAIKVDVSKTRFVPNNIASVF